jgi:hypothetical protein
MRLAHLFLATSDVRRYTVDYCEFLNRGATLVSPAVSIVTAAVTSTVGSVSLDPSRTKLYFYITAGTEDEVFTVAVQVQTTDSEIANDTVKVTVTTP